MTKVDKVRVKMRWERRSEMRCEIYWWDVTDSPWQAEYVEKSISEAALKSWGDILFTSLSHPQYFGSVYLRIKANTLSYLANKSSLPSWLSDFYDSKQTPPQSMKSVHKAWGYYTVIQLMVYANMYTNKLTIYQDITMISSEHYILHP